MLEIRTEFRNAFETKLLYLINKMKYWNEVWSGVRAKQLIRKADKAYFYFILFSLGFMYSVSSMCIEICIMY